MRKIRDGFIQRKSVARIWTAGGEPGKRESLRQESTLPENLFKRSVTNNERTINATRGSRTKCKLIYRDMISDVLGVETV